MIGFGVSRDCENTRYLDRKPIPWEPTIFWAYLIALKQLNSWQLMALNGIFIRQVRERKEIDMNV